MDNAEQHMRPAQVAARTGLAVVTVREFIRRGKLPCIRIGRAVLVPEAAVAAFLRERHSAHVVAPEAST